MAYVHPENQKLLWNAIQKTPIFNNLGSRQTLWFKSVIQHFYEEYPNAKIIKTQQELQTINRATLSFMVNSLKEQFVPSPGPTPLANTSLPSTTGSNERMTYYNDQFNNRQKEYESMNSKPLPPSNTIVDEKISDEAITNMDELIRQQIEQRELELQIYGKSQMPNKISINEEIPKNSVENSILPIDLGKNEKNDENKENKENKEKSKKNVSWKNEHTGDVEHVDYTEFEELKKMVFDLSETIHAMKERLDNITSTNQRHIEIE
jgi:ribosomal protein S18